jgi:hypothetical protein
MSSIFQFLKQNITMQKLFIAGTLLITVTIIGLASAYFFGNDNPIEEACEAVIRNETGAEIDLSPDDNLVFGLKTDS